MLNQALILLTVTLLAANPTQQRIDTTYNWVDSNAAHPNVNFGPAPFPPAAFAIPDGPADSNIVVAPISSPPKLVPAVYVTPIKFSEPPVATEHFFDEPDGTKHAIVGLVKVAKPHPFKHPFTKEYEYKLADSPKLATWPMPLPGVKDIRTYKQAHPNRAGAQDFGNRWNGVGSMFFQGATTVGTWLLKLRG